MIPAIQLTDEAARVADAPTIAAALATCRYRLPGASVQVWRRVGWQVVEQAYDLPDVYASYLEVRAYTMQASIPIHCPQHDLYWLYLLDGTMQIVGPDGRTPPVHTAQHHYRINYLPSGHYQCRFGRGTHRIFYVVHKPAALFREASPEVGWETDEPLSLLDGSGEAIHRFLRSSGTTYLRRKHAIERLSMELVFLAHDSLTAANSGLKTAAEWAGQIRQHIDTCVASGAPVDVRSVAARLSVSAAYARKLFKAHQGETIGSYITKRKLEVAVQLLREGDPPARVARYLGWTPAYFSRAFRAKFGYPPSGGGGAPFR